MNTSQVINEDHTQFIIEGRIDASTAAQLDEELQKAVEAKPQAILVNFEKVEYISSAGLRSILKLAKLAKTNHIKLCCFALQPQVFEVFKISGFSSIISLVDTKEQALDSL